MDVNNAAKNTINSAAAGTRTYVVTDIHSHSDSTLGYAMALGKETGKPVALEMVSPANETLFTRFKNGEISRNVFLGTMVSSYSRGEHSPGDYMGEARAFKMYENMADFIEQGGTIVAGGRQVGMEPFLQKTDNLKEYEKLQKMEMDRSIDRRSFYEKNQAAIEKDPAQFLDVMMRSVDGDREHLGVNQNELLTALQMQKANGDFDAPDNPELARERTMSGINQLFDVAHPKREEEIALAAKVDGLRANYTATYQSDEDFVKGRVADGNSILVEPIDEAIQKYGGVVSVMGRSHTTLADEQSDFDSLIRNKHPDTVVVDPYVSMANISNPDKGEGYRKDTVAIVTAEAEKAGRDKGTGRLAVDLEDGQVVPAASYRDLKAVDGYNRYDERPENPKSSVPSSPTSMVP